MKNSIFKSAVVLVIFIICSSCSKSDDNNITPEVPNPEANLGTFVGNIQVANDPQTNLGYIYNAKVQVTKKGNNNVTIKVSGNEGFDREYIGVIKSSSSSSTFIEINKQIKPTEKIAGTSLAIIGNEVTITIILATDNINVKANPTATTILTISGKIQMIGTNLLRQ